MCFKCKLGVSNAMCYANVLLPVVAIDAPSSESRSLSDSMSASRIICDGACLS